MNYANTVLKIDGPVSIRVEDTVDHLLAVLSDLALELYNDHDNVKIKLSISAE